MDPSYAKNNIPIIASVSEHQPTSWSSFYFDLQLLVFLFPVGLYYCFKEMTDYNIFIILYGVTSIYFAVSNVSLCHYWILKSINLFFQGVMVRLMLVLAPVMCILSGIGISKLLTTYCKQLNPAPALSSNSNVPSEKKLKRLESNFVMKKEVASIFVFIATGMLLSYGYHCIWVTSEAYSSPSIVLSARSHDGSRIIFDDFREAYYWLRMNTPEDAKVMSW